MLVLTLVLAGDIMPQLSAYRINPSVLSKCLKKYFMSGRLTSIANEGANARAHRMDRLHPTASAAYKSLEMIVGSTVGNVGWSST